MNKKPEQFENIRSYLESMLSQPPTMVGLRLRPELDLAKMFGVSRWQIRGCVDNLIEKGILARQRGSGTYVCRIPEGGKPISSEKFSRIQRYSLFADLETTGMPGGYISRGPTTRLHLAYLGDLNDVGTTYQMMLSGIMERANQLGHHMLIQSITKGPGEMLSVEEIVSRLKDARCDGYIVDEYWPDRFSDALEPSGVPTIYWRTCNPIHREPVVMNELEESLERAIHILAQEGWERIALIGLDVPSYPKKNVQDTYERAMQSVGLDYRRCAFSDVAVNKSMELTEQLLKSDNAPDAIYVLDDFVMNGVAAGLERNGIIPGRDIGLITLSNYGLPLPGGRQWSCMEFDPKLAGNLLVENLVRAIQTQERRGRNMVIRATWKSGQTHRKSQ
jgi:DNA-binding LacI/PurR family transcriptional regulator